MTTGPQSFFYEYAGPWDKKRLGTALLHDLAPEPQQEALLRRPEGRHPTYVQSDGAAASSGGGSYPGGD